jgi:transcriptional regulator with XRE-family HTH domain
MRKIYKHPMSLRIKALRIAAGLSQQHLADKANMSRSQLSEIETEVKPANTIRLNAIADALGVNVEDLFDRGSKDQYIKELEEIISKISEDDRDVILRLAKSLAQKQ